MHSYKQHFNIMHFQFLYLCGNYVARQYMCQTLLTQLNTIFLHSLKSFYSAFFYIPLSHSILHFFYRLSHFKTKRACMELFGYSKSSLPALPSHSSSTSAPCFRRRREGAWLKLPSSSVGVCCLLQIILT